TITGTDGNPPTLTFRTSDTYRQALDTILGYFGDVGYRLRYSGSVTYLDFYRVQSANAPLTTVRVADFGDNPLDVNVQDIGSNSTSRDSTTRVIIYGAPKIAVISCYTADANITTRLINDWNPALEAAVLANPESARPGAAGYQAGMEFVFRRFRLPAVLHRYAKRKEMPFQRLNGTPYTMQAWYYPTVL